MLKNTADSYGIVSRSLHWIISILIITLLIVGFLMSDMENSNEKFQIYGAHKATGVIVLLLVTFRLLWRLMNSAVLMPADLPNWQQKAAYFTHIALYVSMFTMPLSGFLMSVLSGYEVSVYGLFSFAAWEKNTELARLFALVHGYTAFCFVGLITLHFLAALYHHFIRKDGVLLRMLRQNCIK